MLSTFQDEMQYIFLEKRECHRSANAGAILVYVFTWEITYFIYVFIFPLYVKVFESLKCVMLKHDSYAQNGGRVCTSITITFPTAKAPFGKTNARKCLQVVLERKSL